MNVIQEDPCQIAPKKVVLPQSLFRALRDLNYFVYITTNPNKTVLYTGVTNDLYRRMNEHFANKGKKETFAGRYYCYQLIYFERHTDINNAIEREKEIKDLSRELKLQLIKSVNPKMNFLKITEDW